MAPPPVGQGSKEPARGGVLGVSSATSFFLEFPLLRDLPLVFQKREPELESVRSIILSHFSSAIVGAPEKRTREKVCPPPQ